MEHPDDFTCFCHNYSGRNAHTFWFCWLGFFFLFVCLLVFSLKSILHHLFPSFVLVLFRAIFILKTPLPPNTLEGQKSEGGKNPLTHEDGISVSKMIFTLAKRRARANQHSGAPGEQTEGLTQRKDKRCIAES